MDEEAHRLLSRCRHVSQRVHGWRKRTEGEWDALVEEIASVNQNMLDLTEKEDACSDREQRVRLQQALLDCKQSFRNGPGGDLRQHLKGTKRPLILRVLLGRNCSVQAGRREEQFRIKDDYHNFRSRVAQCMLLLSTLLVLALWHAGRAGTNVHSQRGFIDHTFSPIIMVSVQVFLTLMVYIYAAMAARESMLLMNGSHIRSWWINHHYFSAITCMICLTLPVDSPTLQSYVRGWLHWTIMQSVLMLAQNRYQQKRMYTQIALGKNSAMDVVGGETSGMPGQLLALLPFLFFLQAWQIALGTIMEMERHESDLRASRGVFVVGIMMIAMGVLNAYYTVRTIAAKRKAASGAQSTIKRR